MMTFQVIRNVDVGSITYFKRGETISVENQARNVLMEPDPNQGIIAVVDGAMLMIPRGYLKKLVD